MEKKTYEELENEVAALKRSCASYKAENTKLRASCQKYAFVYKEEQSRCKSLLDDIQQMRDEIRDLQTRSWWERFKELFWFE